MEEMAGKAGVEPDVGGVGVRVLPLDDFPSENDRARTARV